MMQRFMPGMSTRRRRSDGNGTSVPGRGDWPFVCRCAGVSTAVFFISFNYSGGGEVGLHGPGPPAIVTLAGLGSFGLFAITLVALALGYVGRLR
jgi:hypothetical protein